MLNVAPNRDAVRKRVQRLLTVADDAEGIWSKALFAQLQAVGNVAVFGGAVRDAAAEGVAKFHSDLDLVICDADRASFSRLMKSCAARPNKFGGYRIDLSRWHVDVWMLEDTWAKTAGLRSVVDAKDLLDCTFFSCDAIVFDASKNSVLSKPDYLDQLRRRWIEINLLENPNPTGALVRAIRRGVLWKARFGPRLRAFVCDRLMAESWDRLVKIDRSAFTRPILHWCDREKLIKKVEGNEIWRAAGGPFNGEENLQYRLPLTEQ